jgi:hypothetical protein
LAARKRTATSEPKLPVELLIPMDEANSRLRERVQKGREIKQTKISSLEVFETVGNEYSKWNSFNIELLKRIFTTEELSEEYSGYGFGFGGMGESEPSLGEKIDGLYNDIDKKIHRMDSIIERLEIIPLSSASATEEPTRVPAKTKKVFVVHGHDEIAKTSLEVFCMKLAWSR